MCQMQCVLPMCLAYWHRCMMWSLDCSCVQKQPELTSMIQVIQRAERTDDSRRRNWIGVQSRSGGISSASGTRYRISSVPTRLCIVYTLMDDSR